jgi:hypothetical protein
VTRNPAAEHTPLRVGILNNDGVVEFPGRGANPGPVMADYRYDRAACVTEDGDQVIEKRLSVPIEQRFGCAHAAGSSGGEDDRR